jgi:lipopolysaccharide/colanic/teichoic acid biosynthesis glycosyltransferase
MQVETLKNTPEFEQKQYLHTASFSIKKNDLHFFYIGNDQNSIDILTSTFNSGFLTDSFNEAKKLIRATRITNQKIDVFIIDVPYNETELKHFQSFLKELEVFCKIPVFYNERFLKEEETDIRQLDIIDDIIDLHKLQFDFSSKISFLKKAKAYNNCSFNNRVKIRHSTSYFKRLLDITISLIALIVLLPVFLLIAVAVKLESKGPVFYNAKRAGRGFKVFKFYKFRTMEINADKKIETLRHLNLYNAAANGPKFYKIINDPRITKVGKFLRNTSLDELPQLFNVLKGDMSLVGNRPLPLYEAATLTTNDFVERFMAPAGITGLWQIKKRGNKDMSIEERISLDITYARNSNLLKDFWIMANTPKALIQKMDV